MKKDKENNIEIKTQRKSKVLITYLIWSFFIIVTLIAIFINRDFFQKKIEYKKSDGIITNNNSSLVKTPIIKENNINNDNQISEKNLNNIEENNHYKADFLNLSEMIFKLYSNQDAVKEIQMLKENYVNNTSYNEIEDSIRFIEEYNENSLVSENIEVLFPNESNIIGKMFSSIIKIEKLNANKNIKFSKQILYKHVESIIKYSNKVEVLNNND
jgi:hypothetical protein